MSAKPDCNERSENEISRRCESGIPSTDGAPRGKSEQTPGSENLETLNQKLIDAVLAHSQFELKGSPQTYYQYEKGKELRYCGPFTWQDIKKSSLHAWRKHTTRFLGMDRFLGAKNETARKKALALVMARQGHSIEETFPGLLQEAVEKGWMGFLEELHRAHENQMQETIQSMWGLFLILGWDRQLHAPIMETMWPFCFWSDEAIVAYLEILGASVTLDVWRKFRREMGLVRPRSTVIAEIVPAYEGTVADGIERKPIGFRFKNKVRRLPAKEQ